MLDTHAGNTGCIRASPLLQSRKLVYVDKLSHPTWISS